MADYGHELAFGTFITPQNQRPEGAVVSSKWGYVYTADWRVDADPPEVKHHDVDTFRRQLGEPAVIETVRDAGYRVAA